MPTPAFCALEQAYGDWNFDKPKPTTQPAQQGRQGHQGSHPQLTPIQKKEEDINTHNMNIYSAAETQNDVRSFCPNCNSCLKANDVLQQRIIEQNIWPRPQWVPQYPQAFVPFDPYNRYWANNQPMSTREDFGNGVFEGFSQGKTSPESLLQILLLILVAFFIIQLVECIYSSCA